MKINKIKSKSKKYILKLIINFVLNYYRDVAQPGLEYTSGGRGAASSNLAIPTK